MDFKSYLSQFQNVLSAVVITSATEDLDTQNGFSAIIELFKDVKKNDGTVYLVGNGGSSGIVSHSMVDFVNAIGMKAQAITDSSLLTCMANDYGYENVFKQPLETIVREGDILIAVSSSGNSENIVNAAKICKIKGANVLTLSGFEANNKLRKCGDYNLWLDSKSYGYVEIGHAFLLHYITDMLCEMKYMNL